MGVAALVGGDAASVPSMARTKYSAASHTTFSFLPPLLHIVHALRPGRCGPERQVHGGPQREATAVDALERGRNNGAPVMNGPLGPQGPTINGIPVERPGAQPNIAPPKDVRVLNDAILRAALDLGKRDRARRKMIFIISDGREYGSRVSYSDVLKVLLSREITVYAIGVDSSAIPIYSKLQKLHLPHYGYGDILPKYASATGGEVFTELSRDNIEVAYARATGDARNQYTLGYTTKATPSTTYRDIEVRVSRSGLKISARSGYYPLPAGR